MFAPRKRLLAFLLVLPLAVLLLPVSAQDVDERAEGRLKKLTEQAPAATGDKDKLRAELLAFRRAYSGTPYALKAAGLLAQLPSPLDKLDPATIPTLEKFPWQPKELVAVLGEHRGRQGQPVTCVAFSPDGKRLASGGQAYMRLWDPQTMRLKHFFGPPYVVTSCAFSRDNTMLAAGTTSGYLYVYDLPADDKLPVQRTPLLVASTAIHGVAFAPNGKSLACGCADNATRLYNVSGKGIEEQAVIQGHTAAVNSVAYSPDGKILATGSSDKTVRLWNATMDIPTEKGTLSGPTGEVLNVAINPAGNVVAAGCADGKILLYNLPSGGKPRASFEPKGSGSINGLSFSHTGKTLAAACYDNTLRLWDVTAAKPVERYRLEGHVSPCRGIAYSPDSKLLASGGFDWVVRTWDTTALPKPKERFVPAGHLGYTYTSAFLPDGTALVTGSIDNVVRIWDTTKAEPKTRHFLPTKDMQVHKVAVSPDGKQIAAGGNNKTLRQWDVNGRPLRNCINEHGSVHYIEYTPDSGQLVAAGNTQKEAVLFDAATGASVRTFGSHEVALNGLAVSPDGKMVATCSGTYLYDKMNKIVLDKNNRYVYNDCTIKLWDRETGKELHAIKTHEVPIYQLAFSPDGRRLLSSAYEPHLRIRDLADPVKSEMPADFKSVTGYGYAYGLAYSLDGKELFTLGLDQKIVRWEVATGKRLWEWASPETVPSIALSGDGRHLSVTLATGVIYILRLAPAAEKTAAN